MVDDDELVINSTGHAHAQESHDGHEDQQPDGDPEYLNPDSDAHGGSNRYKPGRSLSAGRTEIKPDYTCAI
jgi:hypothetical protein